MIGLETCLKFSPKRNSKEWKASASVSPFPLIKQRMTKMSVKNYSPKLLDIFKFANQKEFHFDAGSEKKAIALRARLHALRREMRKEKHWLLPIAEGVVVSVSGTFLIARPPDNEITNALTDALLKQGFKEDRIDGETK
jgi:hypothetical protein